MPQSHMLNQGNEGCAITNGVVREVMGDGTV